MNNKFPNFTSTTKEIISARHPRWIQHIAVDISLHRHTLGPNGQMCSKMYTMPRWWCHRRKHPGSTHVCFLELLPFGVNSRPMIGNDGLIWCVVYILGVLLRWSPWSCSWSSGIVMFVFLCQLVDRLTPWKIERQTTQALLFDTPRVFSWLFFFYKKTLSYIGWK